MHGQYFLICLETIGYVIKAQLGLQVGSTTSVVATRISREVLGWRRWDVLTSDLDATEVDEAAVGAEIDLMSTVTKV